MKGAALRWIFAGTIRGKDQLYRTYEAAKTDPHWFALLQDADASLATEDDATIALLRQAMADDCALISKGLMTPLFPQEAILRLVVHCQIRVTHS